MDNGVIKKLRSRQFATRTLLALGMSTCLSAGPLLPALMGSAQAQVTTVSDDLPSFAPMVQKILPAVVNISVVQKSAGAAGPAGGDDSDDDDDSDNGGGGGGGNGGGAAPQMPGPGTPFDELLRRFFEQQQQGRRGSPHMMPGQKIMSLGSGFVIDPTGLVVTNNHVIGDAEKITVIFQDDTRHPAKVIGKDAKSDLALLKIETNKPLPYVSFGDSDKARVGDWVIAVGDPFGLGGSVTKGIISARGRPIEDSSYVDFLQIDASINKGNSGGPTFSMDGKVIGINTAIFSPNGGSVGIGFAIPSNTARPVIEQLKAHGKVERGWLGVSIQDITPDIAQGLGMNADHPIGALVQGVSNDSPASKAGLKVGDVIQKFDGQTVEKWRDLPRLVGDAPIGKTVTLAVLRKGQTVNVDVKLGRLDENQIASRGGGGGEDAGPNSPGALGLALSSITPDVRKRLDIPKDIDGVLVSRVRTNSPAAEKGIEAGDVIVQINQQPVSDPSQVAAQVKAAGAKSVLLLVNRHGENHFVAITPEDKAG